MKSTIRRALALALSAYPVSATNAESACSIDSEASMNCGKTETGRYQIDAVHNATGVKPGSINSTNSSQVTYPKTSTFEIEKDASILKYLNPSIFKNETYMEEVRYRLRNHELVVVHDAFVPEFANHVWSDLRQDGLNWEHHQDADPLGFSCSHHNIYDPVDYTSVMNDTLALFDHPDSKSWIGDLTGRDVNGKAQGAASHYHPGDYSMPHTDDYDNRAIAYVWHLSRDWRPEWGGALYWCNEQNPHHASIPASFNTLHLFSVTRHSNHFVTIVTPEAKSERITFNGWWTASPELMPSVDNLHSLPDQYPDAGSRLNLPEEQVRSALDIFDEHDVSDERLIDWMDDLYHENLMEESTNSFVIDLQ